MFSASRYEVREGEAVTISVRLIDQTGNPVRQETIALTAKPGGGTTFSDYSGVPEHVTIIPPLNEAGFVVTAVKDDDFDTGETVELGFRRPLPPGITAGDPDRATVTFHDPGTEAVTDREVLEALYRTTGGPDWINRTNWLSAAPLSEWYGVGTDGSGRVTSLALSRNRLSGAIPPVLDQLDRLGSLDLGGNELRGEIPAELGRLTHLQQLDLSSNFELSGQVPPELGELIQLRDLDLGQNQLTGGIPPVLGRLTSLQGLNLSNNQLSGEVLPELGELTQLRVLDLWRNQLTGTIPPALGQLSRLERLDLQFNELSGGVPPELGRLTNLQYLSLRFNDLSGGIPPELGELTQLRVLDLGRNQLTGTIPPALGQLSRLERLDLQFNELSREIPPELGELVQLQELGLERNQLTGTIPPTLTTLSNLQSLDLGFNELSGSISPELGELTQLQWLGLERNQLTGTIPPELGQLTNLRYLSLRSNDLSGGIPLELTHLTTLRRVELGFNPDLTGTIPSGLQKLRLSTLDLMATSVCVPEDSELQKWLATIERFTLSGLTCGRPADAMSPIDILVVYTPAARRFVGGTGEMEAVIDLMIAETNQAYLDSGVNQQLVLVAREEVEYTESGSVLEDISRLASGSDGYMDEVHATRDQAGADLVHLISATGDVAFVAEPFAITQVERGSRTFAHELGHNMGLSHDRYEENDGLLPYSHGYVNQQAFADDAPWSARWRTIMAYPDQCSAERLSCNLIMRFSNPKQSYLGDPLGVPGDERTRAVNGPADAVRALNITRHSVAGFRPRASGNRLTMPATLSQARPLLRIGEGGWLSVPVPGGGLFQAMGPNEPRAASHQADSTFDRATLRRREVRVDIRSLAGVPEGRGTSLRLNLFDDVVLTGIIERWTPTYSGGHALLGGWREWPREG